MNGTRRMQPPWSLGLDQEQYRHPPNSPCWDSTSWLAPHQITRVISSPSRSTTGFLTAIFLALNAVAVLVKLRVCCCPAPRAAEFATAGDERVVPHAATRKIAPVVLAPDMVLVFLRKKEHAWMMIVRRARRPCNEGSGEKEAHTTKRHGSTPPNAINCNAKT